MKPRSMAGLLVVAALSCGEPGGHPQSPIERFAGAQPTLEALGERVLHAVVAGDTAALSTLRLTEREHNEVVYPEFSAAESFPVEIAWSNIELRNRRDLGRQLARFRGREVRFDAAFCQGAPRAYRTFEAKTDCWVVFQDAEHGRARVQLFEDVVVRGGAYKLVRYYGGPPVGMAGR